MANLDDTIRLARLFSDLQQRGTIGLLELRNMLGNLFEEFASVRDDELDALIVEFAQLGGDPYSAPEENGEEGVAS